MRKSIFSLLLVISLLASAMILPSFAASSSATDEEASKVLLDLGIIDSADGAADPITRGEFASEIARVMNVVTMPEGYVLPFSDVAAGSRYHNGVYNLFAWKAISASEKFRPDDVITSNEALKIAVSLLGYDFLAVNGGGYPQGYVAAASQLGITPQGLSSQLTKADAWNLMFNMLNTELPLVTMSTNGENNYKIKGAGTLLKERWNIEVYDGMVTDGQKFGINYEKGAGEGFVGIDGYVLKNGGFNTDALFGDEVSAYYDADTNTIRAIYSHVSDSSKNVKIFSNQDISFNRDTYTYFDENDKEETLKISYDATIIYNGQNVLFNEDIMIPENGYVKLISVNSNLYDVVIVKSYEQAVAGTIVAGEFLIGDKSVKGRSYKFDDENIIYENQDGKAMTFEEIKENDVLWISKEPSGAITDVLVCSDLIAGELTSTSTNSVYIDDRKYETTEGAYNDVLANFELGSIVRACINPDGVIVHFISETDISGYNVGYLIQSRLFVKGLSASIYLKILDSDGLIYEYTMADKFVVNGIVFKDGPQADYARLPKQELDETCMTKSVIMYIANRSGYITLINYPDDIARTFGGEEIGLYKNAQITDKSDQYIQYKSSDATVHAKAPTGKIFVGSPFKRFVVPSPVTTVSVNGVETSVKTGPWEDKDYKVQGLNSEYMTNQVHYGYTLTKGDLQSNYMVTMYFEGGSSDVHADTSNIYVVKEVTQIINDEGDEVECLAVSTPAVVDKEFYSEEEGYFAKLNLKFGDLVKIEADSKNKVKGITVFYREGENHLNYASRTETVNNGVINVSVELETTLSGMKSKYKPSEGESIFNSNTGMSSLAGSIVIAGHVYDTDSTVIKLYPIAYDPAAATESSSFYSYSSHGKNIVLVNPEDETVSKGVMGDIKSYDDFGENCDTMVIQTYAGTVNCIYVYQK